MSRFLGGIFGNTVPSTADQPAISGVYTLNGQYYISQEGGWEGLIAATGGNQTSPTGDPGNKPVIISHPSSLVI